MSHYEVQEALMWDNANELKVILTRQTYQDIKNFSAQTQLLEFLNRKLKLNTNDLRIVLLLLRAGTNVDAPDYSGFTARQKLHTLGYSVDRIYLTIKQCEVTRLQEMPQDTSQDTFQDILYN